MPAARSLRPSQSAIVAAAAALALLVPAVAARAASSPLPWVTISPLKGTPDASPVTQVSFLGVAAKDLSRISVRGNRSGGHGGSLKPYATGTGASFVPLRAFTPGETVTVTATEAVGSRSASIGTTFTIAKPYVPPASFYWAPPSIPPVVAPGSQSSFLSAPALHPPSVTVTAPAADPGLGDIFLTPADGGLQAGPMIVNPAGQLVWFAPAPANGQATDLRVQQYLGQTVLTYWSGRVVLGHGSGAGVIANTSYQTVATVAAGNGLSMDLHDFDLEPGGVALITVYEPVWWNLSAHRGPAHGVLEDCVVQEVDVRTGLVMFEWHALGHVPLSASYTQPHLAPDNQTAVWDWFHINSIDLEPDQNLLISSRNTWAVYQVGHTYGEVLWSLGGKASTFSLGAGVRFAWQHDATRLADGSIEIFDNEDTPRQAQHSRGIDVGLDYRRWTATLLHTYVDPQTPVLSPSQGDVQQLANGDQLVGWGQIGLISELSPTLSLTFELKLPPNVQSYRAYRFPWAAQPTDPPAAAAQHASGAATTAVEASWNGATDVAAWQVVAGSSPTALAPVGPQFASAGFETPMTVVSTAAYFAVEAIGSAGQVLATSPALAPAAS